MKPVKPKPLSKSVESWLGAMATGRAEFEAIEPRHARAILAALEYERQRADRAEEESERLLHPETLPTYD